MDARVALEVAEIVPKIDVNADKILEKNEVLVAPPVIIFVALIFVIVAFVVMRFVV